MMQRSKYGFLSVCAVAGVAALTLVGCGSASDDAPPEVQADEAATTDATAPDATTDTSTADTPDGLGEAVFSYGDTSYSVQLQYCSLVGEDALFDGLARDDAGAEVGYLGGDFGGLTSLPHGEARIDFGATGQFESADEFVAMGSVGGEVVVTDSSDTSVIIVAGAWDQDGTQLPTATLMVDCS